MSTATTQNRRTGFAVPWTAWLAVLGSLWLIVTPFIFGYSGNGTALLNDIIVGVVALLHTAYVVFRANTSTHEYTFSSWAFIGYFLVAYWLIVAPHLLGYNNDSTATWNDTITGVIFLAANCYVFLFTFNHMSERA
jgi:hypothetical protein